MPTNSPTKLDQSATKAGNHLTISHSQGFSYQLTVISDSMLNEDQLKCNSCKSFKQLSVLWFCLISRMFSEEDSSGEEIDIYVKLFLFACNAFSKAANKSKKGEKDSSKK